MQKIVVFFLSCFLWRQNDVIDDINLRTAEAAVECFPGRAQYDDCVALVQCALDKVGTFMYEDEQNVRCAYDIVPLHGRVGRYLYKDFSYKMIYRLHCGDVRFLFPSAL